MPSDQTPKQEQAIHSSLRDSLFYQAFFLLVLTVVSASVAAFFLGKRELTVRTLEQLQGTASARESLFEQAITKQRQQLSILAQDPALAGTRSITDIVGFAQLLRIAPDGSIDMIAGGARKTNVSSALQKSALRAEHTTFFPIFDENGFSAYAIAAPQHAVGARTGTLVAIFSASPLIPQLFSADHLGSSGEVLLVASEDGETVLLRLDPVNGQAVRVYGDTPVAAAVLRGEEGVMETKDYAGIDVLAAYRTMPSIGWGIIAKVDQYEVATPTARLAVSVAGFSLMFVALISVSIFFLARRITEPLEELSSKLNALETKRFHFERSIFTGNELEIVDRAADDLTRRLRHAYDHLESIVQSRTEDLRKELAKTAAILESMDYGLFVTDTDGNIIFGNRSAELFTGWAAGETKNVPVAKVLDIVNSAGEPLLSKAHPVHVVLRTRQHFSPQRDLLYSLRTKQGKVTPLQVRVTPMLRGKECYGAVVLFRDISEERRLDTMKSEFISLVSHQLRTPLSSMRWYLEMLLGKDSGPLTEAQEEYVREVATSNTRMVHLVNALLNVSRLELGNVQVNTDVIHAKDLLNELSQSFKFESVQRKMPIEITEENADGLKIRSDQSLVRLILENLLSNALKYGTKETPVKVRIAGNLEKQSIDIAVENSGIGIAEAEQASIGKKLFRGTNAKTSDTDGNGLGLYVSNIAADSIGGKLQFVSEEGKGATFTLTLPAINTTQERA